MNSYRQILRSSAIIGGASIANMVIGLVKVKALAVMLGPSGIGLMGLYQNIMNMSSTLAGVGISSSGIRQLATARGDRETLSIIQRSLWLGNLALGIIGMLTLFVLREPVSVWVFGDTSHAIEIGWLGLGLFFSLLAGSQTALLQGLRRIGNLAKVNVLSAFFGALSGVIMIYLLGEDGVLWFVVSAPAISMLVASYYTSRLVATEALYDLQRIRHQWLVMLKLGVPLMAAALLTLITQLVARALILDEFGLEAIGYFQAAWAISMIYVAFVLNAMGTDYYPRLTETIHDHPHARKLVQEQAEMAILLAAPVFLAMITFAPWVIHLLYTPSFSPAAEILRWQVLGDILKASSWPMGFIVLAGGHGGVFISTQISWNLIYLGGVYLGLENFGLAVVGMAFWFAYLIGYVVDVMLGYHLIGFRPARRNWLFTLFLSFSSGSIIVLSTQSATSSFAMGSCLTLIVCVYSVTRLNRLIDLRRWVASRSRL